MTETYLLMVLYQWGQSPWNLGDIKKTGNTNLMMIFKLDLKELRLYRKKIKTKQNILMLEKRLYLITSPNFVKTQHSG